MTKVLFKYRTPNLRGPAPGMLQEPGRDAKDEAPEVHNPADRWWHESSYDLRTGLQVSDESLDSLSDDLLDELFKR